MTAAQGRAPSLVRPMLATPGPLPSPASDAEWAYELKWDGVRAIAYLGRGPLRLLSRTDQDMTGRYPELARLAADGDRNLILDGELVTLLDGKPSFSMLQQRMRVRSPSRDLVETVPVLYFIFDVLQLDGQSLLDEPYAERRQLLDQLQPTGPAWQTPAWFGDGADVLASSQENGLEGVVAKRLTSTYQPGKRSRDWIKTKNIRMQEVVIGGWTEGQGRRGGTIGALLLGVFDGGELRYAGQVGTGFAAVTLADLQRRLAGLQQSRSPFTAGDGVPREHARGAHWVRPEIVGEVAFAEWTHEDILRHPSWRGYRPDKRPDDVRRE